METDGKGSRERYLAETAAIEAEVREWYEKEMRPLIAEIEAKMTPAEKQAVTDGILARFEKARAADAAGREPETPIQIAMAETLRDVKAAKSREEEDEIIARFRQRSKEIAADYYASQKS
jgi:cytosine/adenosine deaminase-related metal-dependent hydrolase